MLRVPGRRVAALASAFAFSASTLSHCLNAALQCAMVSSSPPDQHLPHQHHQPVRPRAQYALVLSGGVSRRGPLGGQFAVSNTSWSGEPVALDVCYRGFERHLFQPNGGVHNFNIFIHSWAVHEESWLRELYHPVVARFESNGLYQATFEALLRRHRECNQRNSVCQGRPTFLSQKYSLGRAVQALREYEYRHNYTHSMVVMTRPDLLLFGRGLLLRDSARFPPDEVSHWTDYYFVTSSRMAQRFGELYNRCWRDDLGGPGCLTDQGSHIDGFRISNSFFVRGFVTPGKQLRDDGVAVGILTDCVDFELIRKLCAEECVARWTNASQLQLRAVGFDYRAAKGMYGEERCLRGLHY